MMKRLEQMTEPELANVMKKCARAVEHVLGEYLPDAVRAQFVLVVFDDPKVAQYVATCERSSVIEAMRETADRLEAKQDVAR